MFPLSPVSQAESLPLSLREALKTIFQEYVKITFEKGSNHVTNFLIYSFIADIYTLYGLPWWLRW